MTQRGQDPFSPKFQCTAFTEMYSSNACLPSSRPFDETARQSNGMPSGQGGRISHLFRSASFLQTGHSSARYYIGSPKPRKEEWKSVGSPSQRANISMDRGRVITGSLTVPDSNADETRIHWFASAKGICKRRTVRAYVHNIVETEPT